MARTIFCTDCREWHLHWCFGFCRKCYDLRRRLDDELVSEKQDGHSSVKPCQPTKAWPGSEAKIRVLAARYEAHEELHHKDDAKLERRVLRWMA